MIEKAFRGISVCLLFLFLLACKPKMPSTYEVHYPEGLMDSAVFVNYNLTADSSCNFYMDYNLFFKVYKNEDFEPVYRYYLKHKEIRKSQDGYKAYKRLGFYFNHSNDTIEYYSAGHHAEPNSEKHDLKPTVPYQPTRTYNPIRNK
jgi:hypothetical protein